MSAIKEPVKIAPLLERHGSLREIRRRLTEELLRGPATRVAGTEQGPWITISKSMGSDWEGIARRLAERLGWHLYDREILDEVSRESHVRQSILSRLDEREVSWIEDTLAPLAAPERPARQAFLDQMARVILALGRRGNAILVGRGANWLLDPSCGLRVRMVAPLASRVARLATREGLAPEQARERIRREDAARARFIRQVYRQDIDDPSGYDLVINTASLAAEPAVACVLATLRAKLGDVAVVTAGR
jgi:cytidylate kinase